MEPQENLLSDQSLLRYSNSLPALKLLQSGQVLATNFIQLAKGKRNREYLLAFFSGTQVRVTKNCQPY